MRKWISFGSAIKNEKYIKGLLKKFDIVNYSFSINGYGDYDLYLVLGLNTYKISINEEKSALEVYEKITFRKAQKKKKEYFIIRKEFFGLDCWYESLKFIKNINT